MALTYKAYAITEPGKFELLERTIPEPGPGQVRIRVEACGVCHSDSATVNAAFLGMSFPRVPGHEVIGRIEAVADDVLNWKIGQRVGVGFLGGEDGTCVRCRRGDYVNCSNPTITGVTIDGGYAEVMIAQAHGIASVPESLDAAEAAPLLCAGLTTFNALRNSGLRAGDLVAIHGMGGLGHLGIQYARRMGYRTVAIGRGTDKQPLAAQLGAHQYIDSSNENTSEVLQRMGGAQAILGTAPDGQSMASLIAGLSPLGKLIVVSVPSDPISIEASSLVFGGRVLQGSLTGKTIDEEDTLAFSELMGVRAMVETMPLLKAPEAYERMMRGDARFRIVLTM